jgi:hypothetical protein
VDDTYKRIMEDRAFELRWAINAAQAARTPQDKKSGQGLRNYVRKLHRALDSMVPWTRREKIDRLKRLKGHKSGADAVAASEALVRKISGK